ncbi:TPA: hypothetical protein ACH3X1_000033 [Trebouxia sp. C0004]
MNDFYCDRCGTGEIGNNAFYSWHHKGLCRKRPSGGYDDIEVGRSHRRSSRPSSSVPHTGTAQQSARHSHQVARSGRPDAEISSLTSRPESSEETESPHQYALDSDLDSDEYSDAWSAESEWDDWSEADDCDIALDQFGYNPATDQLLQDIEQDDHEEALDNDEHPLREPSYRSARWFALRKDQLVYSGCHSMPSCGSLPDMGHLSVKVRVV